MVSGRSRLRLAGAQAPRCTPARPRGSPPRFHLEGPMLTETFASETPLATEEYAPVSPFAETFQFAPESEGGTTATSGDRGYEVVPSGSGLESPFRSESLESLTEAGPSPERGAYQNFVASLY